MLAGHDWILIDCSPVFLHPNSAKNVLGVCHAVVCSSNELVVRCLFDETNFLY